MFAKLSAWFGRMKAERDNAAAALRQASSVEHGHEHGHSHAHGDGVSHSHGHDDGHGHSHGDHVHDA